LNLLITLKADGRESKEAGLVAGRREVPDDVQQKLILLTG